MSLINNLEVSDPIISNLIHLFVLSNRFSSAVELFKDIRISLSTGGSDAQGFMEYADLTNVKDILRDIENKLVEGLNQNVDYIKSKKITQRTREIATGIIAAEFLTKAGNLDMRFKVNQQKALAGRKKEREKNDKPNGWRVFFTLATFIYSEYYLGCLEPTKRSVFHCFSITPI